MFGFLKKIGATVAHGIVKGPVSAAGAVWLVASQVGAQTNYSLPTTKFGWINLIGTAITSAVLLTSEDPKMKGVEKENGQ
jgi:hypothetical protein